LLDYIWLTFISILTVGYGDFVPRTHIGRLIIIMAAIGGLILSATLIGIINNSVELTLREQNLVDYLKNHQLLVKLRNASASVIGYAWRLWYHRHILTKKEARMMKKKFIKAVETQKRIRNN
jgi:voltage-gated potassium channel Kch